MNVLSILIWVFATLLIAGLLYRLDLWLISLEEGGFIYYRTKSRGGGGNVMFELDKLTRPSVEHIQKTMGTDVESQENDGE